MLIVEAKRKALVLGICSDNGKILHRAQKRVKSVEVADTIAGFLKTFDSKFVPNKIALTLAPTDVEMTKNALMYLKTFKCKVRPVHHLDAHLSYIQEPFLALIANSTNTELVLYNENNYEILGMDIDISLGAAFYRLSKDLDFSLSILNSIEDNKNTIPYPKPMAAQKGLDFSFAGSYYYTLQHIYPKVQSLPATSDLLDPCYLKKNSNDMKILINSFQAAVCDQIQERVIKSINWCQKNYPHIKTFVITIQAFSGGVSQNKKLAQTISKICSDHNWVFNCQNSTDSLEMIRDLVINKKSALYSAELLSPASNYPLGPYKFIS